jgi:hypothetical protein
MLYQSLFANVPVEVSRHHIVFNALTLLFLLKSNAGGF